jgi:exodeoxyribonuclease VII large subunit
MNELSLSVSQAIDGFNELLDQAYPFVIIEGEVSSFKVNQNKFVFFDIKDQDATLGCFMMLFDLKMPIQDGMKVKVLATPKITKWGKFSLTVKNIMPIGEGSLKKSQDLLKQKLENEGLFDTSRKRILPKIPGRIGVVSSSQAAGYKDFIKIVEDRWGGLEILLTDITVQGIDAPVQIVGAIKYLNEVANDLDVIVVIRGGGSADDLAPFSNEDVVRAIAGSRTPTLVGVGHEVDISLADLVADKRASTPSNAAELLVPEKNDTLSMVARTVTTAQSGVSAAIRVFEEDSERVGAEIENCIDMFFKENEARLLAMKRTLIQLDPNRVLRRGYSLITKEEKAIKSVADVTIGDSVNIKFYDGVVKAEVLNVN